MGLNLVLTGLTMIVAVPLLGGFAGAEIAGALFMIIGVIVCWVSKK